jgi:hypothetical protein
MFSGLKSLKGTYYLPSFVSSLRYYLTNNDLLLVVISIQESQTRLYSNLYPLPANELAVHACLYNLVDIMALSSKP